MAERRSLTTQRTGAKYVQRALCVAAVGWLVACSDSDSSESGGLMDGGSPFAADASLDGRSNVPTGHDATTPSRFDVSAPVSALVLQGQPYPTVTFSLTDRGVPLPSATYSLDDTAFGTIDHSTGVFTPSGVAGKVRVSASSTVGAAVSSFSITVALVTEGDPGRNDLPAGAGGVGGVGGEGGGTPISDPMLRAVLDTTPEQDPGLTWLYPYDGTVWPRGLPAPLLSWRSSTHAALAVRVHVEVDDVYKFDGYFGPPSAATAGTPLTHLPLPQDMWRAALQSGSTMRVSIVAAARDTGGALKAYSPASTLTWKIAPGSLKGTVYYNSYGTKLAENSDGAVGGNKRFGGATLSIRGDSYDPKLVAGSTTSDNSGCRVCHTVSGNGSLLMAQRDSNKKTSAYDLTNMNTETQRPASDDGKFGWAALSPDGALALGSAGPPGSNSANVASLDQSALYDVATGSALKSPGFSELVTRAAMPVFSPDGSKVAFNFFSGPGMGGLMGDGKSLLVMDLARTDATTFTFSNPTAVYTATDAFAPGWPSFLPNSMGLVFQRELAAGNGGGEHFATRLGARGELWWTDLKGVSHPLDRANGSMGLPTNATHPDDTGLQYEPAVGPIVAGGYAWVVFTSRRLYGDVATRPPYESDPRSYDLTPASSTGPTTKKLWVFAIDMPPTPGQDPSHPAFYLPAQELYAGNSRGFWVPDACKEAGIGCASGDECCGGYCRSVTEFGEPVCTAYLPPTACANEYENCKTDDDCCDGTKNLSCVGDRCAQLIVYQ